MSRAKLTESKVRAMSRAVLGKALLESEEIEYAALTASIDAGNGNLRHSDMVTAYMAGTLNDAGRASLEAWERGKMLRDEKRRRLEWHGSMRPIPVTP